MSSLRVYFPFISLNSMQETFCGPTCKVGYLPLDGSDLLKRVRSTFPSLKLHREYMNTNINNTLVEIQNQKITQNDICFTHRLLTCFINLEGTI